MTELEKTSKLPKARKAPESSTPSKSTKLHKPHDALFRKSMENQMVAKEFFETNLPKEMLAITDLSSLKIEKDSFVDKNLRSSFSDVLFSSKFNGQDGYFYLLVEHQTKPDHFMAFRLFKYMLSICDLYLSQNPEAKRLPLVYPLVFYTGAREYDAPLNLWDLCTHSELAKKFWTGDHLLVNIHGVSDEELKEHIWSGIMSFFLKHINEPNLIKRWEEIKDKLPEIAKHESGFQYLETILFYTLTKIDANDKMRLENMLKNTLNQKDGEKLMGSLAMHWFHEGEEKGKQKGINIGVEKGINIGVEKGINIGVEKGINIGAEQAVQRTAINLLKEGCDINFISRATGLKSEEIEKLKSSKQYFQ